MKAIILFSPGIDSPVAAYLSNKKEIELIGLNFYSKKIENKPELLKLARLVGIKKLYFADHSISHEAYSSDSKYRCIFCKKMMLRVADYLAKIFKADFIITGDNIGQVATQTIPNLKTVSSVTDYKILRPLLCYNKNYITEIAKSIGTYKLNLKFDSKCPFLPKNPATRSNTEDVKNAESNIQIKKLIKKITNNLIIEKIN